MRTKKHIRQLEALGACYQAVEFANQYKSLQRAWEACTIYDWMLWLIMRSEGKLNYRLYNACVYVFNRLPEIDAKLAANTLRVCHYPKAPKLKEPK